METIPKQIGSYQILDEVGSGGLGRVFRGVDQRSGKTVAVKVLHSRFSSSRKFLGIFHRELLIISRLSHKNIVSYVDGGFSPPNCYIVTEFVDGTSLYGLMKRIKRFPPMVALCITMDVLQGIDYLHLHDVIHSDLSAPNILVDRNGRTLVTDFGLACQMQVEDYKNYMIGTPGYYSPEHITETSIVPQTDLYCVGLILYEMLTGTKAVPASPDRREVVKGMKAINLKRIVASEKSIQNALRDLLKSALQFNSNRRIQSTEAMMYQIFEILKANNIRYTRHATRKFIVDAGLVSGPFNGTVQDIYRGFVT